MNSSQKKMAPISNTPYDDVYRTLMNDCTHLIIPVVNEAFGEKYKGNELIIPSLNEHFINRQDGKENERITDSSFVICGKERKKYHIECQSRPDGSMLVRMFEYDSQIALDDAQIDNYEMTATFPRSAVLFLRHNNNTPDQMKVTIKAENGDEISYFIPILKLQTYTLQDIFRKQLYFLFHFIFFCMKRILEK